MNIRIKKMIIELEGEMKLKGIKKNELYIIANKDTVAKIFNKFTGNLEVLNRIMEYVDKK